MHPIATDKAAAAVGPFSQAIKTGTLLFVSGQLPIDPTSGNIVSEDPVQQLRQCIENIKAIADEAGTALSRAVKTTVLLTDMGGFAAINVEYARYFQAPHAARARFGVSALPKGAKVEVEAVLECPE